MITIITMHRNVDHVDKANRGFPDGVNDSIVWRSCIIPEMKMHARMSSYNGSRTRTGGRLRWALVAKVSIDYNHTPKHKDTMPRVTQGHKLWQGEKLTVCTVQAHAITKDGCGSGATVLVNR